VSKSERSSIGEETWSTIRDFHTDDEGNELPRYEAKFIDSIEKEYIDDEIVLVKETRPAGSERLYHVPREVITGVSDRIPE
jgi:hypothetical protein